MGELEAPTNGADDDVRELVISSISRLGSEQSVPKLIKQARSHKSREVREQALLWLGQLGDRRVLEFTTKFFTR